jgi:predicted DNA-binding ribbon-helix-helix protein
MSRPRGSRKEARLSVSLDEGDYATLCAIARRRDVSVAWVVRQAVAGLIQTERQQTENPELPLIQKTGREAQAQP